MTDDEIVDLLTLARIYDGRVTLGEAEAEAWVRALGRVPVAIAEEAVVAHYSAPIEPGGEYPRIAPGHVVAYYRAGATAGIPVAALPAPADVKASPEFVAQCRAQIQAVIDRAAARWALQQDPDHGIPQWRPGMDKQALALAQAEAARRLRMADA